MTKRTRRILLLFISLTLLGCALTTPLAKKNDLPTATPIPADTIAPAVDTPTPVDTVASATDTPTRPTDAPVVPSPQPSHTPTASATVPPTHTPSPPPPSPSPSPSPTEAVQGGALQKPVEEPSPLPQDVTLMREPVSLADYASAAALTTSDVPLRDLRSLAIRLRGVRPDVPHVISSSSPDYEIGTVRAFKIIDDDNQEELLIQAELRYKTEHLYMWVERGVDIDQSRLEVAADTFENQIYPTNRGFFGSEWTPGVDGDPHLSVLHARRLGSGILGYYYSASQYPAEVRPDSNQMEMFYVNADNANVGSASYLGTLAHEFQHMIHWYNDRNEETWLNEGMSELASLINGFDSGGFSYSWSVQPDTQLNTWSDDESTTHAHYGGAFLFAAYLLDRFGEALTMAVVAHPDNGIASVDTVLSEHGTGLTFTDVFADWVVAAYLDDPELDARFGYELIDVAQPQLDAEHARFPVERGTQVSSYGVDYIYLRGGSDLTLDFYGDTQARLLDTQPHSGDYLWYANRGDDSDMRLTRAFNLTSVSQATLQFWTWYDIEDRWDYGYVMASNDDGATWQILRGPSATDANPHGNSYGWGYTGRSNGGSSWIEEQIDLSAFSGQKILIRFEYITDDALNLPGWAIDDISIPELGYQDDVGNDDGGWLAEGFVRTNNTVPQDYMVQLITFGSETTVQRLPLREDQSASWRLSLADADHAVLLVSALAPVTSEPAGYFYRLAVD